MPRGRKNKHWTADEVENLKDLYLNEKKSVKDCAKALGRTANSVQGKITQFKWTQLRNIDDSIARETTDLAVEKGSTLTGDFVSEVQSRAARATSTGFDLFESMAKAGDLDAADTAIKITERASNMARKAMGLDTAGSKQGEAKTFNIYFAEGVDIKRVDEVVDV